MKRPSPRDSARHEAAHALVAWLSGISLKTCEIRSRAVNPEERRFVTLGFTTVTEEESARVNAVLRAPTALSEAERELLARHLLFAVAGFVAEQHAGTSSQETTGADRRSALLMAGRLAGGRVTGEGLTARSEVPADRRSGAIKILSEAEEQAQKLLADHESAWDGLASLLINHGSLTGDQVSQFLTTQAAKRDR
jgi:ATP-dependent Zn protease